MTRCAACGIRLSRSPVRGRWVPVLAATQSAPAQKIGTGTPDQNRTQRIVSGGGAQRIEQHLDHVLSQRITP